MGQREVKVRPEVDGTSAGLLLPSLVDVFVVVEGGDPVLSVVLQHKQVRLPVLGGVAAGVVAQLENALRGGKAIQVEGVREDFTRLTCW